MQVLETGRLALRHLEEGDAAFILELLNDPSWLKYIGDRGVRTLEGAREYLRSGPITMYAAHGFGLYLVERKNPGEPVGICGLIRRKGLDDVDLGFAQLPRHSGNGYAREAAEAVLAHGRADHGLERIVAIVSPGNERSIRLLEHLGMRFERMMRMPGETREICLYATGAAK